MNPQNPNGDNSSNEHANHDGNADELVDRIARDAGRELRRPAPRDGLASIRRSRRNRQLATGAAGGFAVLAIVVGGVFVLSGRNDDSVLQPAEPPSSTSIPESPTTEPGTPTTIPETPVSAPGSPVDGEAPAVVYTSTDAFPVDGDQTVIDPSDGSVIRIEPVDEAASRDAQQQFGIRDRSTATIGTIGYDFTEVRFDAGTLATDVYPDVDLCEQTPVTVTGSDVVAVPARARFMTVTSNDRYVVTVSTDCPEAGTMGADAARTSVPFDYVVQVFDATRPEQTGRTIATIAPTDYPSALTQSGDGRFVSIETFGDVHAYRIFDLDAGTEVDLGLGCPVNGAAYSRFIGPWIGASSVALRVDCAGAPRLDVRDLANGDSLSVPVPGATNPIFVTVEVDHATFDTAEDAWFTLCDSAQSRCWIGHGDGDLIEVPDVAVASFLPLGFSPGG